mmetsp:Transcript_6965/g.28358  ORF Transcript_6965/g.28358 Transcript_6965/m.28358 type:complete len:284 (-) Transcript_6965:50-901(-)
MFAKRCSRLFRQRTPTLVPCVFPPLEGPVLFNQPHAASTARVPPVSSFANVTLRVSEVLVLVGQRLRGGVGELRLVLRLLRGIDGDLGRGEGGGLHELEGGVARELAREVEEGLLEVVVGLGGELVVLEVLLAVEGDRLGAHLAVAHVHLVAAEDDGDVLAHAGDITVPRGHVLVGGAGGHVEHDDGALAVDVVAVAEAAELLLARGVPAVEADGTAVGVKLEGVNRHADGGKVLLLELAGQVTLDEGGLAGTTVTDEDELESGSLSHLSPFCSLANRALRLV